MTDVKVVTFGVGGENGRLVLQSQLQAFGINTCPECRGSGESRP